MYKFNFCVPNRIERQPSFYRILANEQGSLFLISFFFLMMTTLYVTVMVLSYTTYLNTIENYRYLEQQRIEKRMFIMQQRNEEVVTVTDLQNKP